MTIEYSVSENDYINFNLFDYHNFKQGKKIDFLLRYVLPVAASGSVMLFNFTLWNKYDMITSLSASVILIVVWIVIFPKVYNNILKKQ